MPNYGQISGILDGHNKLVALDGVSKAGRRRVCSYYRKVYAPVSQVTGGW